MDGPRDTSKIRKLLDAEKWDRTYPRLHAFALGRCRSKAQAKDLAQEAIARVYAVDSKWDPEKDPVLERYLMSVVNSLLANERTSAAAQRNVSIDRAQRAAESVKDDVASADEQLANAQIFTRCLARLRERLADDEQALRVLDLYVEGTETPGEIAEKTRWEPNVVAKARLRMLRHAADVAREVASAQSSDASTRDDAEEEVA